MQFIQITNCSQIRARCKEWSMHLFLSVGITQGRVCWAMWYGEKDGVLFAGFQGVEIWLSPFPFFLCLSPTSCPSYKTQLKCPLFHEANPEPLQFSSPWGRGNSYLFFCLFADHCLILKDVVVVGRKIKTKYLGRGIQWKYISPWPKPLFSSF